MDRNKYRRTEPLSVGSQGGPKGHGGPGGQESRGGPGGQEKGPRAWGPRSAEAGLGATESRGGPGGQEKGPRAWVRWRAEAPVGYILRVANIYCSEFMFDYTRQIDLSQYTHTHITRKLKTIIF